ncbi:MAG: histidine phosphatase family protein [Actinomycetota bacterium]|nr:histidine phosphatase family protein [Actinomycetota bacterium]
MVLVRHGATSWSASGRHTGRTDLPLDELGRAQAETVGRRLEGRSFAAVLTSPLERARSTCRIAGLADGAEVHEELAEWDYGRYEGLTTEEIRAEDPGWQVFVDGCPGGESPEHVAARADRVLERVASLGEAAGGNEKEPVVIFSHGHFLRVLAARWLELAPREGRRLKLDTGSISELGFERGVRAIATWNS